MTADKSEVFRKVQERLSEMTYRKEFPITEDTEIYADLGIYGDEIVELVWWLDREFGLQSIRINPFRYAPSETPLLLFRRILRRLFGIRPPQYESFTVRDIVTAIGVGHWPDRAG